MLPGGNGDFYVDTVHLLTYYVWGAGTMARRKREKMTKVHVTAIIVAALTAFLAAGCRKEQHPTPDLLIARYRKQLRNDPDNIEARLGLGRAYVAREMLKEAVGEFQRAVELDSTNSEAHHELGVALRKLNRYDEAIQELQKAIELDSLSAPAHNSLGLVYYQKQRRQKALEEFKRAVRIDPKFAQAHYNLGVVYRDLGDYEKASHHWQQYKDLQRSNR